MSGEAVRSVGTLDHDTGVFNLRPGYNGNQCRVDGQQRELEACFAVRMMLWRNVRVSDGEDRGSINERYLFRFRVDTLCNHLLSSKFNDSPHWPGRLDGYGIETTLSLIVNTWNRVNIG